MNSDTGSLDSVCFRRNDFKLYVFLMFCIIMYLCFILKKRRDEYKIEYKRSNETFVSDIHGNVNGNAQGNVHGNLQQRIIQLQQDLFACKTAHQTCVGDLRETQSQITPTVQTRQSLNRIYNPLVPPERTYPLGKFNQAANDDYQQMGFIFNNNDRYPLYGRPKYPGRTEKYEYYIIDETRNRLKIPYKSRNDNELYDGDSIRVDILNGDFTVKIYDFDNFRYNPDIL